MGKRPEVVKAAMRRPSKPKTVGSESPHGKTVTTSTVENADYARSAEGQAFVSTVGNAVGARSAEASVSASTGGSTVSARSAVAKAPASTGSSAGCANNLIKAGPHWQGERSLMTSMYPRHCLWV